MKCDKCCKDFPEPELHESHDIPCYLFQGETRKETKPQADKFGRHWLCKDCHYNYDFLIVKKCLESIGETIDCIEELSIWQKEIKKLPEELKIKFRGIAMEMSEQFF